MTIYTVRAGDSLWGIARRFSTTVERLAALNSLSDPSRLVPGLALAIPTGSEGVGDERIVNAYAYPTLSAADAAAQMESFSLFCPFSCHMTAEGALTELDDGALIAAAKEAGVAPLLTVTNIGEGGGFSSDIAHAVFSDSAVQDALFARILARIEEKGYRGVNFNIEYVYPFDREGYNAFLRRAAQLLHSRGRLLSTAIAPKESDEQGGILYAAHDYAAHGESADWVILMTYEWGYTYSAPQAVSPVNRIRRVLDYAVEQIPRQKILMGFSNYAYNWTLPWKEGQAARVLSNSAAANLAISRGAEIRYDAAAAAPFFRYTDAEHIRHEVWFEDVRSAKARLELVEEYGLGGISYWTVNFPNPAMLLEQRESFAAAKLE